MNVSGCANSIADPGIFRVGCALDLILIEGADKLPAAQMLFDHRLIAFEQDDKNVNVSVETPSGCMVSLTANTMR